MNMVVEILSYGMLVGGAITFIALISGFKAAYGRYSDQSRLPVFFLIIFTVIIMVIIGRFVVEVNNRNSSC